MPVLSPPCVRDPDRALERSEPDRAGFLLYVEDGDAVDATRPDRVTYALVDRAATRRCTARRLTPFHTVVTGNVLVEDSRDVPRWLEVVSGAVL